jgi:hypothetical protein
MINFYKTPLGKKMATVYPAITKETSQEGAKLGKWVGSKIM